MSANHIGRRKAQAATPPPGPPLNDGVAAMDEYVSRNARNAAALLAWGRVAAARERSRTAAKPRPRTVAEIEAWKRALNRGAALGPSA